MTTDQSLIAFLDQHRDELLRFLARLVACRTDSQSEGNDEFPHEARRCHELLRAELSTFMTDVDSWTEDELYPVTVARLAGGSGSSVALNGHIDVVPVGEHSGWSSDPWTATERDGNTFGRGTADMKAGVVAAVYALRAIHATGTVPGGDVWLHLVSDEEVVGMSTRRLLRKVTRPDAVIDMEPSSLAIMPVEGGLIHLRIEVEGIETHAGNRYTLIHPGEPAKGVSAIEKLFRIVSGLQELERTWAKKPAHPLLPPGFNTIFPGLMVGGPGGGHDGRLNLFSNAGTVSNYASVEYNIWYLPDETFDEVQAEIEQYLEHVSQLDPWLAEHPPRLTWKLGGVFFPPVNTPRDHPLVVGVSEAVRLIGREPTVTGFGAASELAWYAEHDIPGVLFGPGSIAQAHSPDEFVPTEEVVDAAKVLACAIRQFR